MDMLDDVKAPRSTTASTSQALIGAREALTEAPEAAQFRWRATCNWMNGTHSRSSVDEFFGLGAGPAAQDRVHLRGRPPGDLRRRGQRRDAGRVRAGGPRRLPDRRHRRDRPAPQHPAALGGGDDRGRRWTCRASSASTARCATASTASRSRSGSTPTPCPNEIRALVAQSQKRLRRLRHRHQPDQRHGRGALGVGGAGSGSRAQHHHGGHRCRACPAAGHGAGASASARSTMWCSSAVRSPTRGAPSAGTRSGCSRRTGRAGCRDTAMRARIPTAIAAWPSSSGSSSAMRARCGAGRDQYRVTRCAHRWRLCGLTVAANGRRAALVIATGACNIPTVPRLAEAVPALDPHPRHPLSKSGSARAGRRAGGRRLCKRHPACLRDPPLGPAGDAGVGEHIRAPRTYRGKDIQWWMDAAVRDQRSDEGAASSVREKCNRSSSSARRKA